MDGENIFGSDVPLIEGMSSVKEYNFQSGTSVYVEGSGRGELLDPISAIRLHDRHGNNIRMQNLQAWQATSEGKVIIGDFERVIQIGRRFAAHVDDAIKK